MRMTQAPQCPLCLEDGPITTQISLGSFDLCRSGSCCFCSQPDEQSLQPLWGSCCRLELNNSRTQGDWMCKQDIYTVAVLKDVESYQTYCPAKTQYVVSFIYISLSELLCKCNRKSCGNDYFNICLCIP